MLLSWPHIDDAAPDAASRGASNAATNAHDGLDRMAVEVSEAERRRLGEEFHDGVGQRLTSVAISAAMIAHKLELKDDPLFADAQRMVRLVDEAESVCE